MSEQVLPERNQRPDRKEIGTKEPVNLSPLRAKFLLLLAGAVWGMGFVAQDTAMAHVGPMAFVGLRFVLAGIALVPFAVLELRRQGGNPSWSDLKPLVPVGLVFFAAMALQQVGLLTTSVTNAGFLTALYVVIVPLIMLLVFQVRQPVLIWPASLMALTGVYLLSDGALSLLRSGDWLMTGCALFWAIHVILIGKVGAATGRPVTMATIQFLICGVLGLATHWLISPALLFNEPPLGWSAIGDASLQILYAGLIAGGLAFTLQAIGQMQTSPAVAGILLSSESLFAALFGAVFLGERLSSGGYAGCAIIFAAIVLVSRATASEQTIARPQTARLQTD